MQPLNFSRKGAKPQFGGIYRKLFSSLRLSNLASLRETTNLFKT